MNNSSRRSTYGMGDRGWQLPANEALEHMRSNLNRIAPRNRGCTSGLQSEGSGLHEEAIDAAESEPVSLPQQILHSVFLIQLRCEPISI